jgi:hypothetical protein
MATSWLELTVDDILDYLKQADAFTFGSHGSGDVSMVFSYYDDRRPFECHWKPLEGDLKRLAHYVNTHFEVKPTVYRLGVRWYRHTWDV